MTKKWDEDREDLVAGSPEGRNPKAPSRSHSKSRARKRRALRPSASRHNEGRSLFWLWDLEAVNWRSGSVPCLQPSGGSGSWRRQGACKEDTQGEPETRASEQARDVGSHSQPPQRTIVQGCIPSDRRTCHWAHLLDTVSGSSPSLSHTINPRIWDLAVCMRWKAKCYPKLSRSQPQEIRSLSCSPSLA